MPWFNASWTYRFKVTSQNAQVAEAVDNVYYDLANAPAGFWSHVKSDGGDIRVTRDDGTTEVAREVSGFNQGSQIGSLYFKATGLSTSLDTDYYIYYGNAGASEPGASDANGKNNVWTSYLAVFHLDEASGNVTCSKSGTTGTVTGATLGATGKLRTGASFDASTEEIVAGDNFDITAASLSFSAWINPTSLAANMGIFAKIDGDDTDGYRWRVLTSGAYTLYIGDATTFTSVDSNTGLISTGTLQHAAVTYDGSNVAFYHNAGAQGGGANTRIPTNGTAVFTIGNFPGLNFQPWVGILDEIRVSTSVRSQNWWTTEYNNQNAPNTFWVTSAEETDSASPTLSWLPRVQIVRGRRVSTVASGMTPPGKPE